MSFARKLVTQVFLQSNLPKKLINSSRRICSIYLKQPYTCGVFHKIPDGAGAKRLSHLSKHHYSSRVMGALSPLDPNSFSRPELAVVKHVSLLLDVDFDKRVLSGEATLNIETLSDINDVILDIKDITIESIENDDGAKLEYKIDETVPNIGSKLTVLLKKPAASGEKKLLGVTRGLNEEPKWPYKGYLCKTDCGKSNASSSIPMTLEATSTTDLNLAINGAYGVAPVCLKGDRINIKIKYTTSPNASGLQWLEPSQTSGKKYPYLFSQCQPIHARSILPCQDTPAVKFTYDAKVTAPEHLTVLMSALRQGVDNNRTSFNQPMPLPSYLVAIAVGALEARDLGPRSKVWAEKEEIDRSAWEFAETEKYLQAAERLCGKYEWSQYDLLVLPPSFPYGGMENPCLTFVTPTLLAGDRSQADVIVHEIMHSWTGNLVTNRNFEHFWLNEGFTVFLERKVGASLISDPEEAKKSRDFHSLLGLQELTEAIHTFGESNALTNLVVDLNNTHPDDAFSRVPYEKGSLFLRYIEDLVGGPEVFDDFLRSYLSKFSKKSLDTTQFQDFLLNYFKDNENIKKIDWNAWLHTSGMPPIIPDYDKSMTEAIATVIAKLEDPRSGLDYEDVKKFTPHQTIHFLQQMIDKPALPIDRLRSLGEIYKISTNKNSEILYRWLRLCIKSKDISKLQEAFDFVNSQGRMKYVRPIYRDLYAWEDVRPRAIENFLKNEKYMMHVSAYTLRKDLHLDFGTTKTLE